MKTSIKDAVLSALIKSNDFISGEGLSEQLGVSRTSIWKAIKRLKEEGFEIESVNNKGYKIMENPDDLVESLLQHDLSKKGFEKVRLYETIDSTNLEAKRLASSFAGNGIFISKEQTLGKGRRGRTWLSPKGTGHYMSLVYRPDIEPMAASMLTLLAGLAVCKSLNELYNLETKIKWPNDIVINGKKICGILTEMSAEIDAVNYVVIGIGINVYQKVFSDEIKEIATSVMLETKLTAELIEKHKITLKVVDYLNAYMLQFAKTKDLSFVKKDYEASCVNISGELRIEAAEESYIGLGKGITNAGHLIVQKENGQILEVNAGEVSVRGIYGYV